MIRVHVCIVVHMDIASTICFVNGQWHIFAALINSKTKQSWSYQWYHLICIYYASFWMLKSLLCLCFFYISIHKSTPDIGVKVMPRLTHFKFLCLIWDHPSFIMTHISLQCLINSINVSLPGKELPITATYY